MKVIVIWKDGGGFGMLGHGGSRGSARVFEKDQLDPRCGELPFYATLEELTEKAEVGSQHAAQLPLSEALVHGLIDKTTGRGLPVGEL